MRGSLVVGAAAGLFAFLVGEDGITDLVYVNFKAPDYAGHVYNMDDPPEARCSARSIKRSTAYPVSSWSDAGRVASR